MIRFDETYSRLTGRHFPDVKKAAPGAKDQRPTKMCRVCSARRIQTIKGKPMKTIYIFAKLVLHSQDFILKISSKYTIRN